MTNWLIKFKKFLWLIIAIPLGKLTSEIVFYLFPVTHVNSLQEASLSGALLRAIIPAFVVGYCISKALKKDQKTGFKKSSNIKIKALKQLKLSEADQNYQLTLFLKITIVLLLAFIMFVILSKNNNPNDLHLSATGNFQEKILKDPNYINANEATKEAIREKYHIKLRTVRLPDGKIVEDVPNYLSDEDIINMYQKDYLNN